MRGNFPLPFVGSALKDWDGPEKGERPSAYIVILCDLTVAKNKQWMRESPPRRSCCQLQKRAMAVHDRKLQAQ